MKAELNQIRKGSTHWIQLMEVSGEEYTFLLGSRTSLKYLKLDDIFLPYWGFLKANRKHTLPGWFYLLSLFQCHLYANDLQIFPPAQLLTHIVTFWVVPELAPSIVFPVLERRLISHPVAWPQIKFVLSCSLFTSYLQSIYKPCQFYLRAISSQFSKADIKKKRSSSK